MAYLELQTQAVGVEAMALQVQAALEVQAS
jgi:hypothetical protein